MIMVKCFCNILILLMIAACLSCNDEAMAPDLDYDSEVVVFGLFLITEKENVQQKAIRLERSYKVTEKVPPSQKDRAIKDALVFVESKDKRVQFEYLFDNVYLDNADELQLLPGELYKLDITLTNGHKITAECIMPDRPKILSPAAGQSVAAYQPLTVTWEKARFAHRYEIAIDENFDGFQVSMFSASDQEDLYSFLFAGPDRYTVTVASLDQNYYDYLRSRSDREPISHINGALGVFGAMAYDRERFIAMAL
ncbi:DUF4249 family protein [candidate division KSB1 bacterium]|nr:DUF4249 family protein [candidate division KSB1 bacterium]RQW04605.1 MAG: DUF4249 domain-containing protein [candidate division KSB1 bacterium]